MAKPPKTKNMILDPTEKFMDTATEFLSPMEILLLEERLEQNPEIGVEVPGTFGRMRELAHPSSRKRSDYGHYPVVVYFIDQENHRIVPVIVTTNMDKLKRILKATAIRLLIMSIVRILSRFLTDA